MSQGQPSAQTADQRSNERRTLEAPVTMQLETASLIGSGDNISRAGLLFYTDQPLRVTVEVQEEGGLRRYTGRLIRLQRLSESSTGLAVEFDPR